MSEPQTEKENTARENRVLGWRGWRALVAGVLFAATATAAPLPDGFSLEPNLPPGRNFDLSHWYLGTPDPGQSRSIPASDLMVGHTNAWFFTGPDGAMVFWAPVTGGTTPNSSYPRSELREQINPPDNGINWTAFGAHVLDAQCKVTRLPSTGKVIIGQIHGYVGAARPLLKFVFSNGAVDAQVKQSPSADTDLHVSFPNVPFNGLITYRIVLQDGLLIMTINGVTQSVDILRSDPQWANQTFYFKAGSYCQDNSGSSTEGAQVEFYQLAAAHGTFAPVPPSIIKPPASTAVPVGSNVVLSVSATGGLPLDYHWLKDGVPLAIPNNSILPIYNAQLSRAGLYHAVVSNTWGTATSAVAVLTVLTNFDPISLSEALDTRDLIWSTTGSPAWEGHYSTSHDGLDAARSRIIADSTTASFQTTVNGPGLLSFWWRVSSETNGDYLILSFNSAEQARISGGVDWVQRTFNVPAGSQVLKWSYSKNGSAFAGQDMGWVDEVQFVPLPVVITNQPVARSVDAGATVTFSVGVSGTPPLRYQWQRNGSFLDDGTTVRGATTATLTLSNVQPAQSGDYSVRVSNAVGVVTSSNALLTVSPVIPLAEALDGTNLVWTTNGTPPWIGQNLVTHDSTDAARSGAIADGATTDIQTTVNGPGTVTFWWKVSSQTNSDMLLFTIGGTERARISGESDWRQISFSVVAGSQLLRWTYSKNSSTALGKDRAWVDQVSYERLPVPVAPGNLSATPVSMSRIDLAWTDTSTNESGFLVERSTNGTTFTQIASLGSNVTTYANTGLLAGAIYQYRVRATNAGGASGYSAPIAANTLPFTSARINFQPASAPVPAGYLVDGGLVYGDRGNGLIYGWSSSRTSSVKDRNSSRSPDQRYDTFITTSSSTRWELALPNGIYNVFLVAGDAGASSGTYKHVVEGVMVVNGVASSANRWVSGRANVTVTDGRLTLTNVPGASSLPLCFIDVVKSAPLLTCQPNKTVECGVTWNFDPPATANDPCGGSNIAIIVAGTVTNAAGICGFTATRTWRVVDGCDNTHLCSQTVTVVDTTPPTLAGVPAAATVECSAIPAPAAPTATDTCAGTVAITYAQVRTDGDCVNRYTLTRTWTATDVCGNASSQSQVLTVVDTTPPAILCGDIVTCDPNLAVAPTASDSCDPAPQLLCLRSDGRPLAAAFPLGATTVTCAAIDACGNSSNCTFTVTVLAPLDASGPADQTVLAGSDVLLSTAVTGSGPLSYVWKFNGDVIPGATVAAFILQNVSPVGAGSYCVEITGPCNSVTNSSTLTVLDLHIERCTLTQGFYSDTNGQFGGLASSELLTNLLTAEPLIIGKPGVRSVTLRIEDAVALAARMPAGGPATELAGIGDQLLAALPLNEKERLDNALLGQTITLALNCRLDTALPSFVPANLICTRGSEGVRSFGIPASVLESLISPAVGLNDPTVAGLLELANRGLAGLLTEGATLGEIHQAVEAVNAAFDGCRTFVTCTPITSLTPGE